MPTLTLLVNGARRKMDVPEDASLLSVLRHELDLTGSKYGCGEGQCGACTVLLDDAAVKSCVTPVKAAAGKSITTIEGLEQQGKLHPVQEAFLKHEAMQCGYCTPGLVMATVALLRTTASPSEQEITRALNGNMCRCGVYPRVVSAVRDAAAAQKGRKA